VTLLWLTPVFYTILTFRTLRELFQSDSLTRSRTDHRHSDLLRDKQEHTTLDVVLLTDMVWHVVIDMIDISYMMFLSNPFDRSTSIVDPGLVNERPETVETIRVCVGVFIFLGLFFHQQSFPSIGYMASSSRSYASSSGSARQSQGGPTSRSDPVAAAASSKQDSMLDYRVDVVKARKRSAIVSILMVDLPFLVIRTYMYILSMNTAAAQASQPTTTTPPTGRLFAPGLKGSSPFESFINQRQLDKFWVKNILCMLLQAMQLRFVQQADLERSQSLRWWDLRRSSSDTASFGARRRRSEHDRQLRRKWQEMDRGKLEAAMQDTGGFGMEEVAEQQSDGFGEEQPNHAASSSDNRMPLDARAEAAVGGGASSGECPDPGDDPSGGTAGRHCWRLPCCCRRRPLCCSYGILAHVLMGSVLGWLIAKVDFNQALTDLKLGLGRQS